MTNERYSRQTFLGADAQRAFDSAVIAVVGLGGGGSHVVQQLAHLGVRHLHLFDADKAALSNMNRLVGASLSDVNAATPKVEISRRMIERIDPTADVTIHESIWQNAARDLRSCDIIISCVDSFVARQDLEATGRRYMIPIVDIGMDVFISANQPHIAGQVILSMPGGPCMKCLGFLSNENLKREADLYGAAGGRPQVVWANGILASLAIGIVVDLVTGWNAISARGEYLHFDGNRYLVSRSPRLEYAPAVCPHFPDDFVGEPVFL